MFTYCCDGACVKYGELWNLLSVDAVSEHSVAHANKIVIIILIGSPIKLLNSTVIGVEKRKWRSAKKIYC